MEALAFLHVERIDAQTHPSLLRTAAEGLSLAAREEPPGELAKAIAAMSTLILVALAESGDSEAVEPALIAAKAALDYPQTPYVIYAAATAWRRSYDLNAKREHLDQAIDLYRLVDERLANDGVIIDAIRADLLLALLMRAVRYGLPSDWAEIDERVGKDRHRAEAIEPCLLYAIGLVHLRCYEKGDGREELERALRVFSDVQADPADPKTTPEALNSLGVVHQYLFEESGELGHLTDARSAAEGALAFPGVSRDFRAEILSNLGALCLREFEFTNDVRLVDKAIEVQREAVNADARADDARQTADESRARPAHLLPRT